MTGSDAGGPCRIPPAIPADAHLSGPPLFHRQAALIQGLLDRRALGAPDLGSDEWVRGWIAWSGEARAAPRLAEDPTRFWTDLPLGEVVDLSTNAVLQVLFIGAVTSLEPDLLVDQRNRDLGPDIEPSFSHSSTEPCEIMQPAASHLGLLAEISFSTQRPQSARNALTGSTLVARRAGTNEASSATRRNTTGTLA